MTYTLFNILDAIRNSDYEKENLINTDAVCDYAENGMNIYISKDQALKIIKVAKKWAFDIENGNGEWSRMRHEAKKALSEEVS